ncbi:hypothetical protein GCM10007978_05130 [Shewanella hanedai]|nr:hypothetical protein GCM10007978_05130 [Shewanella hanedai]
MLATLLKTLARDIHQPYTILFNPFIDDDLLIGFKCFTFNKVMIKAIAFEQLLPLRHHFYI